jgi:type II secretory pathway component GspD/PulD (secretin)
MVARAKASTWFNLVAGLMVAATAQPAFAGGSEKRTNAAEQPAGATLADSNLNAAAEALGRGEYDRAAACLDAAEADAATAADPRAAEELNRLKGELAMAARARRAGANQIRLLEEAIRQGQTGRASELLQQVSANTSYLTTGDQERLTQLSVKVRAAAPDDKPVPSAPAGVTTASSPGGALATAQAKAKLQMARAQMAQFNFERAEQLAHEAERLQPKLASAEDSPKKVLADLAHTRTDPKALLTAARVALGRKDYDRAEQFAKMSEKYSGPFTFPFWGDSPARVLKDVQDLRGHAPATAPKTQASATPAKTTPAKAAAPKDAVVQASATTPAKPKADPSKPKADPSKPQPGSAEATAQAVALIKQARQALASGDAAKAKKLNDQARVLKPNLHWWEDNPEKVQSDIVKAEAKAKPAVVQAAAKTTTPAAKTTPATPAEKNKPLTKDEAVALVKKGRTLLAENKIDDATKACLKARSTASLSWGLFEDSPEKLRQDIDKARVKRDREESAKVLADARRLYEEGKYDDASKAAYRAQKLHGAYNIWELGDRPERVLADIDTAKIKIAKGEQVAVVKKDKDAVVKKDKDKDAAKKPGDAPTLSKKPYDAVATAKTPAQGDARQAQARQALADAREALKAGDTARAKVLAEQVRSMHVVLNAPGDDSPEAVLKDARKAGSGSRPSVAARTPPVNDNKANDNKARAVQLLADARELRKAQKLLEARAKVIEALQLHASFTADEEGPETAMQNLAAEANWQVDWLLHEAVRVTGSSGPDMAVRFQNAERALVQATALASGFGLDVKPLQSKLEWVRGQLAVARGEAAPAAVPAVAAAPKNQGQELLEKARLEIQRGETESARKLAEDAARGPYGVQEEAFAVLRSIAAEEGNQRRLQSNRTFDAALAAYNRRDFANAANLVQTVDPNSLDESRRSRLREIAMTPEMQPAGRNAVAQKQPAASRGAVVQVGATEQGLPAVPSPASPSTLGEQPGVARAEDKTASDSLLTQTEAMRQVKFQMLRQKGLEVQREASERFRTGQTDAAIDELQDYMAELNDAQLELGQMALLRRPVESRLQQFKLLKAQRDFIAESDGAAKRSHEAKTREVLNEQNKDKKVAELMKQYNTLFKEGKYPEAERLAMQAHELDPDNTVAAAAMTIAKQQYRLTQSKKDAAANDNIATGILNDGGRLGPDGIQDHELVIDKEAAERTRRRGDGSSFMATRKSDRVLEIERRLLSLVTLNFTDTPLRSVIDDLRAWQGINIYVDTNALTEDGISLDTPVTVKLEQIPMKSALNLLLHNAHLTWTVADDVLKITTPRHAKGALRTNTYPVADLVIPVNDFGQVKNNGPLVPAYDVNNRSMAGATTPVPYTGPRSLTAGESTGTSMGNTSTFGTDAAQPQTQVTKSGAVGTTEEKLIGLIKSTVQPNSWSDTGGPGTIDYFPLSMSLVINQTPDIQEQVYDLLQALRRLQDQEIAIEIRFISLEDDFFERIGVNFNMNILTKDTHIGPQITTGIFQPDAVPNVFTPKNTIIGIQPNGSFTPDLNIPIPTQTYTQSVPDFGGYNPIPGYGGITMGLAFLSDIQVFLFMEAVQGDTRSNVMQAPKLTLFNGQTSTISVNTQQTFTTGVQVVPQSGIFTFIPQVQSFPLGVALAMQGVITADRRFVRMSLNPILTNLSSQNITLFPVVVPLVVNFDNASPGGQVVTFTQFIQQPIFSNINVATTVVVPDGGTVVMGGLKLLSEERKEFGPPILSKIPYINRLFKNTSYGRNAQSLLIMVTPRIIIQEEEEEKQTGYIRPQQPQF